MLGWLPWLLLLVPMLAGEFVPLFGDDWEWIENVSPFHWLAEPFVDDPDWGPALWMLAGSVVAIVIGFVAFRARDLRPR